MAAPARRIKPARKIPIFREAALYILGASSALLLTAIVAYRKTAGK
jgi:hypothetical protein